MTKIALLTVCALALVAAVSGEKKPAVAAKNGSGSLSMVTAHSKNGPAIATNNINSIAAPIHAHPPPVMPKPIHRPAQRANSKALLDALKKLVGLEENHGIETNNIASCDEWDKTLRLYESLAGKNIAVYNKQRPNAEKKTEACRSFVDVLTTTRKLFEEFAEDLDDLVDGKSDKSRLDLVNELGVDYKNIQGAIAAENYLEKEFESQLKHDERLKDFPVFVEDVVEAYADMFAPPPVAPPSLEQQLQDHPEFFEALMQLDDVVPVLENLHEASGRARQSVDKLKEIGGLPPQDGPDELNPQEP